MEIFRLEAPERALLVSTCLLVELPARGADCRIPAAPLLSLFFR